MTSGTLQVGTSATPGAAYGGSVAVQASGTLAGYGTVSGNVTDAGTVTPGGTPGTLGTLTVTGNVTQAAGSTLAIEANPTTASELAVGGAASLGGTLALTFDAGAYTAGTEYTLLTAAGGVTGTFGALTQSGANIGFLTPELTYQADAVDLTLVAGLCAGSPTLDCEAPRTATLLWGTQITATTLDVNTQSPNTGTLVLSAANNQQTSNNVIAGTLSVSAAGNLGSAAGALTLGGTQMGGGATTGTLLMTTGITWAGSITTAGTGGTLLVGTGQASTLSGNVNDAAGLTVGNALNTGTLTLSGVVSGAGGVTVGGGTLVLSGTNTYQGGTAVTGGGTVSVSNDANLGNAAAGLTLDNGTLALTGNLVSARGVTLNAGGGTVNTNGFTGTVSGVVGGAGALTVTGGGTLALGGANTYMGGTTVTGGSTVSVSNDGNLGAAGDGTDAG